MATEPTEPRDLGPAADPGEDRVLTVPNALSFGRLLCAPVFLYLLFGADEPYAAAWLLGGLGATDWVDGYVARRFNQVSTFGKVLDPTADRILLAVGIIAALVVDSVPTWVAIAAIVREAIVAVGALIVAAMGGRRIDVQWAGKAGTFAMMFAFPFFLASGAEISWAEQAEMLGWLFAIPGLAFGWYAAVGYVPLALRAVREGRVGSTS